MTDWSYADACHEHPPVQISGPNASRRTVLPVYSHVRNPEPARDPVEIA